MSLSFCGQTVRKHDPDRFLLSLFTPSEAREDIWALCAFNHEIARTRDVVTDTRLGLIRLQWWRDALAALYDGKAPQGQPVLSALAAAIARRDLPRDLFDALVYAREFDLEDRQPATLDGMARYAEFTAAPLLRLCLRVLGEEEGACADIATGYALTGLLRAAPAHARQRRCYLPQDRVPETEGLYAGSAPESLKPAVRAVAEEAERRLCAPVAGPFARRHAALARMYLGQIRRADCDVFHPILGVPPFLRELRVWLAAGS